MGKAASSVGSAIKKNPLVLAAPMSGPLQSVGAIAGLDSIFNGGKLFGNFFKDLTGASAADAAGLAAMAQLEEAKRSREAIMGESRRLENDAMALAQASPEELRSLTMSLQAGERQLAQDQRLLDAIDPQLMAASEQVLNLIRGGPAKAQTALTAERDAQRNALVDRLRTQLGPGAETSAVGLKALRDFDIASSANLAREAEGFRANELQGLGQIMGVSGSLRPDLLGTGINMTGLASTFRNRQLNTRLGVGQTSLAALSGANAPVIQGAGAPFVRDQLAAQGRQSLYNTLIGGGFQLAGGLMGGKRKTSEGMA